jgi:hypothetical protein
MGQALKRAGLHRADLPAGDAQQIGYFLAGETDPVAERTDSLKTLGKRRDASPQQVTQFFVKDRIRRLREVAIRANPSTNHIDCLVNDRLENEGGIYTNVEPAA